LRFFSIDYRYEAISTAGKSFNVGWSVSVIAERIANLLNAKVQTLIEIDKSFIAPDVISDFFSSNDLASAPDQKYEHLRRLRSELHPHSMLSQLSSSQF